jgi:hypothetical protein
MSAAAEWIENLANPEPRVREAAARALHRAGERLGEQAVAAWRKDGELSALLEPYAPTVGIAVLPESFARIRRAFGSPNLADVPPDQDAREFELHIAGASLDILTVRDEAAAPQPPGAIARFLEKFGEGMQQVEYQVSSVDRATELLRAKFGLAPIYPATRQGAGKTRVNFFLCAAGGGKKVLVELVELP